VTTQLVDVLVLGGPPRYAHPGDAGADLEATSAHILAPGERALVDTGVSIALPDGYVAYVVPRSGLALKHGISLVNSPGVIDAGYRGEIRVVMINHDLTEEFAVNPGDRIAQVIVHKVAHAIFHPVAQLPGTERSEGGFGSTGAGKH
jgi:dUTP pyrophosphatase